MSSYTSVSVAAKPLILVFPFGVLSHYLRCIILCRHFSRYFDVRIAYHPDFTSFIEQEGIHTFHCSAIDASSAVDSIKQFDFSWMNESVLEQVYLEQVKVIRQLKPVAVLGDHSPTLKMSAETSSVTFISLINGYMSKYYAGHRKISRTHPAYKFVTSLPSPVKMLLTKLGEAQAFGQLHKPFRKIRQRYQLASGNGYLDELEGDINLVCDLQDLFPQRQMPSHYQLISPLFYEASLKVCDQNARSDKSKKTILATMGSTGDWSKLSFLNDPYYKKYNVVATGDAERVLQAAHILHLPFVNIHELFPAIDLMICHGGNGTIYQALLYQVPVLCKTSHCEQEWNIDALEKKQLGKNLDKISGCVRHQKIIEEWIQKKGHPPFRIFSEKIKKEALLLPGIIKQVADGVSEDVSAVEKINEQALMQP